MKITVVGATGGTGRQLVEAALRAGHHVTAVVRDPVRLPIRHERLDVVVADVLDPESIRPAVAGRAAVLSTLGPRRGEKAPICSAGMRSVAAAMRLAGTSRLVAVSANPVATPGPGTPPLDRLARRVLWMFFRTVYRDLDVMERELRESACDWTVVRPPRLTDGPATGRYRSAVGGNPPHARTISRADVADAMLRLLDDPGSVRTAVGVAN